MSEGTKSYFVAFDDLLEVEAEDKDAALRAALERVNSGDETIHDATIVDIRE